MTKKKKWTAEERITAYLLRRKTPVTVAEIAFATGLGLSTAYAVVSRLELWRDVTCAGRTRTGAARWKLFDRQRARLVRETRLRLPG